MKKYYGVLPLNMLVYGYGGMLAKDCVKLFNTSEEAESFILHHPNNTCYYCVIIIYFDKNAIDAKNKLIESKSSKKWYQFWK
jgi:hypothetical protein